MIRQDRKDQLKYDFDDATKESKKESAIFDLAEQNAKNSMKALVNPYIEQLYSEYELEIKFGGV